MDLRIHANATTTPRARRYIQESTATVAELAEELGVGEKTIRRWRSRTSVEDRSHTVKNLAISLTPIEEALVIELRTTVGLSLDDIVEVISRCINPDLSRSAIHRCLQRHGVSKRPEPHRRTTGTFEDAEIGFIHADLKHLPKLQGKPAFVFVAIDRATRFVHIEIVERRDAATIAACLKRLIVAFPYKINVILTDNGAEFTDRYGAARWTKTPKATGRHAFDVVCKCHGIEHRLTRPFSPQTNGMVERFNRRLTEAIAGKQPAATNAGKNKFLTHAERNTFLTTFVHNYNRTRLRCIGYKAPAEMLDNRPGHNTFAGMTSVGRRVWSSFMQHYATTFNGETEAVDVCLGRRGEGI